MNKSSRLKNMTQNSKRNQEEVRVEIIRKFCRYFKKIGRTNFMRKIFVHLPRKF